MKKSIDISGKKFGKLTAIKAVGKKLSSTGKIKSTLWECQCDCGNIIITTRNNLYISKSCGCTRLEHIKNLSKSLGRLKPSGWSARNKLMRKYEAQAGYRNLEWNLSIEQFNNLTKQNCYYCGKEPSQIVKLKGCNGEYIYNGIGRIDNTSGYVMENCVSCCKTCNIAKAAMSVKEFKIWIDRVYNHQHLNRLSADIISYTLELKDQIWGDGTAKWYQELVGKSK